jgi:hypothetical protein
MKKAITAVAAVAIIAIIATVGSVGWGQQITLGQELTPEPPSDVQDAQQPTTSTNQTDVRSFTFVDIHINLTEDGAVRSFESSSETINGTNEQLREQFAQLMQTRTEEYYNMNSTTFINTEQLTAQVYGRGQATPEVFNEWFEGKLAQQVQEAMPTKPPPVVWITVCTTTTCNSTHG